MDIEKGEVVGLVDFDKVVGVGGAEDIAYCFSGSACGGGGGGVEWDHRGGGAV